MKKETGPHEVASLLRDKEIKQIEWNKIRNNIPGSQTVYVGKTMAYSDEETFVLATKQEDKPLSPLYSYHRAEIGILLKGTHIFGF